MSDDNDLIRRVDAIEALKAANLPFGYGQAVRAITNVPAVQVAVKPLVWVVTKTYGGEVWDASAAGGVYRIIKRHQDGQFWLTHPTCEVIRPTLDAAKTAAQADYDARIRSALTVTPTPDAAKVAALVEAAEARGAMPEGYCFCSTNRIGDDSKMHEPECRDLRAALAAMKEVSGEA